MRYEAVAVWIEGLALLAIFVWDRIEHKEQTKASHNAERAWVMTELDWPERIRGELRLTTNTSRSGVQEPIETTTVTVKLICRNEGRSPAWIDQIYGYAEIYSHKDELSDCHRHSQQGFGNIGPLAPCKEAFRILRMTCPGHMKEGQYLSIYVGVEYRDIFGFKRETFLGYVVQDAESLARQDALNERNRNT